MPRKTPSDHPTNQATNQLAGGGDNGEWRYLLKQTWVECRALPQPLHPRLALGESLAQPRSYGVFRMQVGRRINVTYALLDATNEPGHPLTPLCSAPVSYWGNCESDNFDRSRMERVLRDGSPWRGVWPKCKCKFSLV